MACKATAGLEWARIEPARAALEAWPEVSGGRLTTINVGENATFRVDSPRGRFALRLYRPRRWSDAEIQVEHEFMHHLGPRVGVLPPLPGRDGETLQGRSPESRAALLPWLPGRCLEHLSPRSLEQLGTFVAHLHRHCRSFQGSGERVRWDARRLVEVPLEALRSSPTCPFERGELRDLEAAASDGLERWGRLDLPEATLHCDLHWGNLKRHQGGFLLLDFDDCGWAPLSYDLATVAYANPRCKEADGVDYLVKGYNREAEIPTTSETIHLLTWARYLSLVGWILERPELFTGKYLAERLRANLERARRAGGRIGLGQGPRSRSA